MENFVLSSEQCLLLAQLGEMGSIRELAQVLNRDESVISRQIKQIAELAPVVEKREKKWILTSHGRQIADWTRDSISSQKRILSRKEVLKNRNHTGIFCASAVPESGGANWQSRRGN